MTSLETSVHLVVLSLSLVDVVFVVACHGLLFLFVFVASCRGLQCVLVLLICQDNRHGQTGATCCERKGPTAYFIPLFVDFIKDLDFRRIILEYENEPSMKVSQEAMIHSCVVAVREMQRQCRILRISVEHSTSVRITDDSSLLNRIPYFAMQFLNKMRRNLERNLGFIKLDKKVSTRS